MARHVQQPTLFRDPEVVRRVEESTQTSWVSSAVDCIKRMSETLETFTADDLRNRIGDGPTSGSVGGAFRLAQKEGIIEHVGRTPSVHRESRGRSIKQWRKHE